MSVTINGTNGLTFNDNTTQATSPFAGGLGFRNRIINGDCRIDQRNNGASFTPTTPSSYGLDRWRFDLSQASKLTGQRSSTVPAGYINAQLITSSSAYSVLAADYFTFGQPIEGLNVADLGWGTASAQTVTLSFWVRSSLTGTFGGAVSNSAQNRSYPFTYTISVANTYEYKTITIPGDTTGTWLTTNGTGIWLFIGLGVGSTFSGTAGAWAGAAYLSATGATSVVSTNGATFYITGVQLEKGSTATSFDYRPYGTELALCQRYFWQDTFCNVDAYGSAGMAVVSKRVHVVTMRATPTVTQTGAVSTSSNTSNTTFTVDSATSNEFGTNIYISATGAARTFLYRPVQASAEL